MDYIVISKGLLIGIIISLPVGPLGIMSLRRMLLQGPLPGFFAGLGIAVADIFYSLIAALGLGFVATTLKQYENIMKFFGGILLIGLGIFVLLTPPIKPPIKKRAQGLFNSFFSMFLLTLSNPTTLFLFAAFFVAAGIENMESNYSVAIELTIGVFIGTVIWWLLLALITYFANISIKQKTLYKINAFSGITIIGFGIATLICVAIDYLY